jgi:hypothetical protein
MKLKDVLKVSVYSALIALTACGRGTVDSDLVASKDGNNNITRNYEVAYSEQAGTAYASATFTVANDWFTTVKLKSPSRITVNGLSMREDSDVLDGGEVGAFYAGFLFPPAWILMGVSGTSYSVPLNASSYQFEWTDQNGKVFTDVVPVSSLQLSAGSSFDRAQGGTIKIIGAVDADIYVRVRQGSFSVSTAGRGDSATLTASDFGRLAPGIATMEVEVRQKRDLPVGGNAGGEVRLVYKFAPRTVQLL